MAKPVFILAGQSNAAAMEGSIISALDQRYGTGEYTLVSAHAPGAPLVFQRPGLDWQRVEELPSQLAGNIADALRDPDNGSLAGMIWLQGEADTYPIAPADTYADEFVDLLSQVSGILTEEFGSGHGFDDIDIVISELADTAPAADTRAHWGTIIDQQNLLADRKDITSVDPDVVMARTGVSVQDAFRDHLHYSTNFQDELSTALVTALPDVTADAPLIPLADLLTGTRFDDTFFVDHLGDRIEEPRGSDNDHVMSSVDFSLRDQSQRLEHLSLLGAEDLRGAGNGRDNAITGNDGDNALHGLWGNDTLDGGAGADLMDGGHGDDFFLVDDLGDRLMERAGQGHDAVRSEVSLSLRQHSQHLEELELWGTADLRATGNGRANLIKGNDGDNRIDGAWGRDTLDGGAGNDTLVGGHHGDVFHFGDESGHDVIRDFEMDLDRLDILEAQMHTRGDAVGFLEKHGEIQNGEDLFLDLGDGRSIKLLNVVDDDLAPSPEDFADIFFV